MSNVRGTVRDAFASLKGSVEDTVKSVKGTLEDTAEALKDADLKGLMERHPWFYVGGLIALGYVGYRLLGRTASAPGSGPARPASHGNGRHETWEPDRTVEEAPTTTATQRSGEDWSNVMDEIKALAVGVPLSILRDKLADAGADAFRSQVVELMNALTAKLGGKVIRERQ